MHLATEQPVWMVMGLYLSLGLVLTLVAFGIVYLVSHSSKKGQSDIPKAIWQFVLWLFLLLILAVAAKLLGMPQMTILWQVPSGPDAQYAEFERDCLKIERALARYCSADGSCHEDRSMTVIDRLIYLKQLTPGDVTDGHGNRYLIQKCGCGSYAHNVLVKWVGPDGRLRTKDDVKKPILTDKWAHDYPRQSLRGDSDAARIYYETRSMLSIGYMAVIGGLAMFLPLMTAFWVQYIEGINSAFRSHVLELDHCNADQSSRRQAILCRLEDLQTRLETARTLMKKTAGFCTGLLVILLTIAMAIGTMMMFGHVDFITYRASVYFAGCATLTVAGVILLVMTAAWSQRPTAQSSNGDGLDYMRETLKAVKSPAAVLVPVPAAQIVVATPPDERLVVSADMVTANDGGVPQPVESPVTAVTIGRDNRVPAWAAILAVGVIGLCVISKLAGPRRVNDGQ